MKTSRSDDKSRPLDPEIGVKFDVEVIVVGLLRVHNVLMAVISRKGREHEAIDKRFKRLLWAIRKSIPVQL